MFHSLDRSSRRHQHSSVEMAASTVVLVPKTPTTNSQNDLRSEKPEVMHFDLAPSKGEAGPSNYGPPPDTSHFLPTTDADVKKQEEKNKEKEEAEKWIQNYTLKQRDEKLLKTIDPEYIEIMRVFREQQEFEGHVRRRAEEAAGVTAEETTT
jgi:hypothetical protein